MNTPLTSLSSYALEHASIRNPPGQLQIVSTCNAKCLFCSNEQNPFEIVRLPVRSMSDIKQQLWATPRDYSGEFALNESLPGRISEGEAFLHPGLLDIVQLIRSQWMNGIRMTTNGSLITEPIVKELSKYSPIRLSFSIPSISEEYWCKIFNLGSEEYTRAMQAIPLLRKYGGIAYDASIVPLPGLVGYADIVKTFKFFADQGIQYVRVWSPGYTDHTPATVTAHMQFDAQELSGFLADMRKAFNLRIEWSTDPNLIISHLLPLQQLNGILLQAKTVGDSIIFCSSLSAGDRVRKSIDGLASAIGFSQYQVVQIPNYTYGGNICVTGLWLVQDFLRYFKNNPPAHPSVLIIPYGFLDSYGYDLQRRSILELYDALPEHQIVFI